MQQTAGLRVGPDCALAWLRFSTELWGDACIACDRSRVSPPMADRLFSAVWRGDAAEAERLLQDGANVNAAGVGGWTPLHWASMCGRTQVVPILLRAGAVVDARGNSYLWTPLMLAAMHGHAAIIKLLLEAGAVPCRCAELLNHPAAVEALDSWAVRARGGGPERCYNQ